METRVWLSDTDARVTAAWFFEPAERARRTEWLLYRASRDICLDINRGFWAVGLLAGGGGSLLFGGLLSVLVGETRSIGTFLGSWAVGLFFLIMAALQRAECMELTCEVEDILERPASEVMWQ